MSKLKVKQPVLKQPTGKKIPPPHLAISKPKAKQTIIPSPVKKLDSLTQAQKNRAIEKKAEMATKNKLRKMGYNKIYSSQHNGIHGIDVAALKMDKTGKPISGAVVEVKGRTTSSPGPSILKKQTLKSYVEPRMLKAEKAGIAGASDLNKLYKQGKVKRLGSIYGKKDQGKGPRIYEATPRGLKQIK